MDSSDFFRAECAEEGKAAYREHQTELMMMMQMRSLQST